jgi:hypothetical protein
MPRPRGRHKTARITVNFEPHEFAVVLELARKQDVPVAWLIRRAVIDVISREQEPLEPLLPLTGAAIQQR